MSGSGPGQNGWQLSGSDPPQGRKQVLKRSLFTHVQQLPVNSSSDAMSRNTHCEPVLNDFGEIRSSTSASESDAEEFYDFDNADLPTTEEEEEGCTSESAAFESNMNTPVESFSEMTLSIENLTAECNINDVEKKADNIPPRLPQCSQSFFDTKTDIGTDAIKYWPPPSRTEAFHLSEAIIKFTRDVEAAKQDF